MRRRLLLALAAIALVAVAYQFVIRDRAVAPRLRPARPTAEIGSGSSAVGVSAEGAVLFWLAPPKEASLPRLPLSKPPASGQLTGTALQQARILGAAPRPLRPYLRDSRYGESGVDVELSGGIELRFGDDSEAARKWRAASAVLADPSVTTLDYVNLSAPGRAAIKGSGHSLPPVP